METINQTPSNATPNANQNTPSNLNQANNNQQYNPNTTEHGMSYQTKTLIVVLCLLFAYPIGLILMFIWMKWPWWVKTIISLGVVLFIAAIVGFVMILALNPKEQLNRAIDANRNYLINKYSLSINTYYVQNGEYPKQFSDLVPEYISQMPTTENAFGEIEYTNLETDYMLCIVAEDNLSKSCGNSNGLIIEEE